jgi:mono/diheme cytochrome c family protein
MFVNSVRLPLTNGGHAASEGILSSDPFSILNINTTGILQTAKWIKRVPLLGTSQRLHVSKGMKSPASTELANETPFSSEAIEAGSTVFKVLCTSCHTVNGHLAIRTLVEGKNANSIQGILDRLAQPVDITGQPTTWSDPDLLLSTWRGRRMPPFAGTEQELELLSLFLVSLAGEPKAGVGPVSEGQRIFEEKCIFCHGSSADWPMERLAPGSSSEEFFEKIGRLPEFNPIMPPFEGTENERHLLADFLSKKVAAVDSEEGRE